MPFAEALTTEAEGFVEPDRRLVVRKDVQLELRDACAARPLDRLLEERASDSAAAVLLRNHQPEIGDVCARRMRVATDREAAHDSRGHLGYEHRRIAGAPQGP